MGSGDWFKAIVCRKKTKQANSKLAKQRASQLSNGFKWWKQRSNNATFSGKPEDYGMTIEDFAATQIQTAFRRFKARKTLSNLKGLKKLQTFIQDHPAKKQSYTALHYIQSWSRIQAEVRARRAFMVIEGRNRQKKQENQMKLEAKFHDLEGEWCGGSETMEEIIARILEREEAAVRRERALAYAFSHQWRPKSGNNTGPFIYNVGKDSWGWSWMDRWIAARPWEPRLPALSANHKKGQPVTASRVGKNNIQLARKVLSSVHSTLDHGIDDGSTKRSNQQEDERKVDQQPKLKADGPSKLKPKISG